MTPADLGGLVAPAIAIAVIGYTDAVVVARAFIFANAEDFKRRALRALDEEDRPVRWFLLNAEANVEVDLTGLDVLDELRVEVEARGLHFGMARVKQDLMDELVRYGLVARVGPDHIWPTLPSALAAIEDEPGTGDPA